MHEVAGVPGQLMVQFPPPQLVAMHPWDALQVTVQGPSQSTRHSPELRQVTFAPGPTTETQSPELWQSTTQLAPQLCSQSVELLHVSEHPLAHCWLQLPFPVPPPLQTQLPPSQEQLTPLLEVHAGGPPRVEPQLHPLAKESATHRPSISVRMSVPSGNVRGGTAGPCTA